MNEWISINDSLPALNEDCIIHIAFDEDGDACNVCAIAYIIELNSVDGQPAWMSGKEWIYPPRVTHWRPLTFVSPNGKPYK